MGGVTGLFKDPEFLDKLVEKGYQPTEAGFKKFLLEEIKTHSLAEIGEGMGISWNCVNRWIKRLGVKNPRKRGGSNNPYGIKGKNREERIKRELRGAQ